MSSQILYLHVGNLPQTRTLTGLSSFSFRKALSEKLSPFLDSSVSGGELSFRFFSDARARAALRLLSGEKEHIRKTKTALARFLNPLKIDFVLRPADAPLPRLFLSDMDSTLIREECIEEIADYLNIKDEMSRLTEKAMNGEVDFAASLRDRILLLKGLDQSALESVYRNRLHLTAGARELVSTLRSHGCCCALISGGFDYFSGRFARDLGFHYHKANTLELAEDGSLTGTLSRAIISPEAKVLFMEELQKKENCPNKEEIMAAGDGANDIPMLREAGFGVAFHGKQLVREQTEHHIHFSGLDSLILFSGFLEKEEPS